MKEILKFILIIVALHLIAFAIAYISRELQKSNNRSINQEAEIIQVLKNKYCPMTPDLPECAGYKQNKKEDN
jgi:hypothetical protein